MTEKLTDFELEQLLHDAQAVDAVGTTVLVRKLASRVTRLLTECRELRDQQASAQFMMDQEVGG